MLPQILQDQTSTSVSWTDTVKTYGIIFYQTPPERITDACDCCPGWRRCDDNSAQQSPNMPSACDSQEMRRSSLE